MPKMKSNKGARKRFRKTGGKVIKRARAFRRHILTKKSRGRKRRLRQGAEVHPNDVASLQRLLPY